MIQPKASDLLDKSPSSVTYVGTMQAWFATNCLGCHAAGGRGRIALDTYGAIKAAMSSVTADVNSGKMPQDRPLSASDLELFQQWANAGMPNAAADSHSSDAVVSTANCN